MCYRRQTAGSLLTLILMGVPLLGCNRITAERSAAREETATAAAKIVIDNFTFDPPELTIAPGTIVTWSNRDDVPHTATSTAKPRIFDSGALDTDQSFSHTFTTPGTFEYFCAVHPKMTGRIIVK